MSIKDWFHKAPVTSNQQWYQSACSDSWKEPIENLPDIRQNETNPIREPNHTESSYTSWDRNKRKISPEAKRMLKEKMEEVIRFNTRKLKNKKKEVGESSKSKDRRPRCFICRKRGHVCRKCPQRKQALTPTTPIESVSNLSPSSIYDLTSNEQQGLEKALYQEWVHVLTDYMIEGSDRNGWNNIWYISSAYKHHMSPMKHLFKRLHKRFKVEGVEEDEKKFIFSYGVGEAIVGTKNGDLLISNVLYTPEISLNILSLEQLQDQGFIIDYGKDTCEIRYMFDNWENNASGDIEMKDQDDNEIIAQHNSFLEDYFKSLSMEEECSLIKGLEDLNMDKNEEHDYLDQDYMSLNGTLYAMRVNTFPRLVSFLNLIKIDRLVYTNWEILSKRFIEMLEWFYMGFMRQSILGKLPPTIGMTKVDLLGLYKIVDEMGGYMNVTFNNKWDMIAKILGLTSEERDSVKECYKEYISLVKIYYEEALRTKQGKAESDEDGKDVADTKPQPDAEDMEEDIVESPKKRFKTGMEESEGAYKTAISEESSESDDFIVIV